MQSLTVDVGNLYLVPSRSMLESLPQKRRRAPDLPDPMRVVFDLQTVTRYGGVPVVLTTDRNGTEKLLVYPTADYYIDLYQSHQGDGYSIGRIDAVDLHEMERLAKGSLRVRAAGWHMLQQFKQIPPGQSNHWRTISAQWHVLEQQIRRARNAAQQEAPDLDILTPAHERYLDTLDTLIDVTRQLEQEKQKQAQGIPYKSVEATGEERVAPRDIYVFQLLGNHQFSDMEMLRLRGNGVDMSGRVYSLQGNKLTVKFEGQVNWQLIPPQGNFERVMSNTVFRTQQQAVDTLRERQESNKHLLRALIDRLYRSYNVPVASPQEPLNREQEEAFRRALTVPDLLLVLGPPGTGKTRTITEVVRQSGVRKQRVLVTSRTHKAVDNVLERLSDELLVVRFGHEDRIAEKLRHKMIDKQARSLLEETKSSTNSVAEQLQRLDTFRDRIEYWIQLFTQHIAVLRSHEQRLAQARQQRDAIVRQVGAPFQTTLEQIAHFLQRLQQIQESSRQKLISWQQRQASAETRVTLPVLGLLFTWLVQWFQTRITYHQRRLSEIYQEQYTSQQEYARITTEQQRTLQAHAQYRQSEEWVRQLEQDQQSALNDANKEAQILQQTTYGLAPTQPPLEPANSITFQRYLDWYQDIRPLLEKRRVLLQDWRKELSERTEQLYPELLQYADVVGATCIGVATAKGLENIEFDLAIVDEAGQIGLPDLLVPLVRARRAMLVGDHQQLPPFVASEVQTWLDSLSPQDQMALNLDDETDAEQVTELLTRSAFELLFTRRPSPDHVVRFIEQRRMPEVIADFVSEHFYGGRLRTAGKENVKGAPHRDPLFQVPMVFIDTSDLPPTQRRDKTPRALRGDQDPEGWGQSGYYNELEGRLIVDLVEVYQQANSDWVVIVPYQAQVRYILDLLRKRIANDEFKLEERVATVDAFQGGERDVVLYGFTRSNPRGSIGFLKELRRLNVAMTRAKQQLVLVGDLSTLKQANDEAFRHLASELEQYVAQNNGLMSYDACRKLLPPRGKGGQS
jgi:hypothetical protein